MRVTALDGWLALKSQVPPKERRGLVLVDPPFEVRGEYERLADGLVEAHKRFATGLYCLWYPKKAGAPIRAFHERLGRSGVDRILCAELDVKGESDAAGLSGSGLVIVNPPRRGIGPELATRLEACGASHVIYSSCNVDTLARDLAAMPSLRPVQGRVVDMFPQTRHVETALLLRREPPGRSFPTP